MFAKLISDKLNANKRITEEFLNYYKSLEPLLKHYSYKNKQTSENFVEIKSIISEIDKWQDSKSSDFKEVTVNLFELWMLFSKYDGIIDDIHEFFLELNPESIIENDVSDTYKIQTGDHLQKIRKMYTIHMKSQQELPFAAYLADLCSWEAEDLKFLQMRFRNTENIDLYLDILGRCPASMKVIVNMQIEQDKEWLTSEIREMKNKCYILDKNLMTTDDIVQFTPKMSYVKLNSIVSGNSIISINKLLNRKNFYRGGSVNADSVQKYKLVNKLKSNKTLFSYELIEGGPLWQITITYDAKDYYIMSYKGKTVHKKTEVEDLINSLDNPHVSANMIQILLGVKCAENMQFVMPSFTESYFDPQILKSEIIIKIAASSKDEHAVKSIFEKLVMSKLPEVYSKRNINQAKASFAAILNEISKRFTKDVFDLNIRGNLDFESAVEKALNFTFSDKENIYESYLNQVKLLDLALK